MYGNALQRLPPALAAATGLTRLVAAANPLGPGQPNHDPLAVLQQLPRLRELCLADTGIDDLPGGAWLAGGAAGRGRLASKSALGPALLLLVRHGMGSAAYPPRRLRCIWYLTEFSSPPSFLA